MTYPSPSNNPKSSATSKTEMAYISYTLRQLKTIKGAQGNRLKTYWKEQVSTCPTLNLPFDFPRPGISTFQGDVYFDSLDQNCCQKIYQLAETSTSKPFSLLLSVFYILLGRLARQTDIPIGIPMSTSSYGQQDTTDHLVGMIANSLLCRVDLSDNPSFQSFLKRVEQAIEMAHAHRDYPLWLLSQEGNNNSTENPLISVAFSWEEQFSSSQQSTLDTGEQLNIEPYPLGEQRGGSFDLYLTALETPQGIQLCWKYSTDLFERSSIIQFANRFRVLLAAVIDNPQQLILQIPFLTEAERVSLLTQANSTCSFDPPQECIHALFEAQVQRTPNAVATVFEGEKLTYQQLNQRANQLAHYLHAKGLQPEALVAVYLQRSISLIVALLGVLKSGAAYLPLNPDLPQERLDYMLKASQIDWGISDSQLSKDLANSALNVLDLDTDWSSIAQHPQQNLNTSITPRNLAYVIYTSGSTGKPKGVMIEHQSVTNFIRAAIANYELTPVDRILQFASISFDAAVEEIYPCLSVGSTLVLRPSTMLDSIPTFLQHCQDYQLTVLDLPTAFWHQLVDFLVATPNASVPSSVRLVIIGGEKVNAQHVHHWYGKLTSAPLVINTYGPTEATVVTTLYKIPAAQFSAENLIHTTNVPIGKALNNIETYILDEQNQLVPPGGVGELHVGGLCLARGYLNAAEKTQAQFIPHPFRSTPQARLYKTGDLVRYLPDGNLEYIGRADHQVKIRGYRVELGEIESTILQYPSIQQALVIAHQAISSHSQRLIAYVVSDLIPEKIPYQTDCLLELEDQLLQIPTQAIAYHTIQFAPNTLIYKPGTLVRLHILLPGESEKRWLQGTVLPDASASNHPSIELQLSVSELKAVIRSIDYLLGTQRLISTSQRVFREHLKKYLETRLPDYMIPSAFVLMNALPLNANGKVDRTALPIPSSNNDLGVQIPRAEAPQTPIEKKIAKLWQEILGRKHIGIHTSFLEFGGNSLQVIELLTRIQIRFAVKVSTESFLQNPTIAQLATLITDQAQLLDSSSSMTSSINLASEAQLDDDIQFCNIPYPKYSQVQNIFLTGATGSIGPYLLSELLKQTTAKIHCLVREKSLQKGQDKIINHLKANNLWQISFQDRVIPVLGDLSKPRLGLTPSDFDGLAKQIDTIYHNGAWVNFIYNYASLKATNVLGTQEILRLAGRLKLKPVHYISTLSIFSELPKNQTSILETDLPNSMSSLDNGYDQTKCVAEHLIHIAKTRGLPASIYRLGTVLSYDARDNKANLSPNFFKSLIQDCLKFQRIPDLKQVINLTPIDYIGVTIAYLSQQPSNFNRTFHVVNPNYLTWDNLFKELAKLSPALKKVSYPEWLTQLNNYIQKDNPSLLKPFLNLLDVSTDFPLENLHFDCQNTQQELTNTSFQSPCINADLFRKYWSHSLKSLKVQEEVIEG